MVRNCGNGFVLRLVCSVVMILIDEEYDAFLWFRVLTAAIPNQGEH